MIARRQSVLPLLPNRVWRSYKGGRVLDAISGRENPADSHYPEDWLGSLTKASNPNQDNEYEGVSQYEAANGESRSLAVAVAEDPDFYLGSGHMKRFGLDTRILAKYLDSAIRLHFQVHPTATFSSRYLGVDKGKTEAYLILAIRDDVSEPYIYAGFQRPPKRSELKRWIETQNLSEIEACFDKIPVSVGDVFLIPGGCPHALGEGILMIELMEASDLVVRFEFERGGYVLPEESRYMGKDLDFCLDVFDLRPKNAEAFRCQPRLVERFSDGSELIESIGADQTDCFRARSVKVVERVIREESGFYIVVVIQGSGVLRVDTEEYALSKYDRFFVASESGPVTYESKGDLEIVELAGPPLT